MHFIKMHALGNDFVVIDARGPKGPDGGEMESLAKKLCHRRLGIGADQMLVLAGSKKADFRMLIFNADGSEVEMCGNGIRCLAKYIWDRGISAKSPLDIETMAGIIRPQKEDGMVRVDMGRPVLEAEDIPVKLKGRVIDHQLRIGDRTFSITCVSMGNPHAVTFIEDVEQFPIGTYGPAIENHELFPKRTNVEFIEVLSPTELRMRVWERGAGVTMACGTGASAAAVAASLKGLTERKVTVRLDGGDLSIEWAGNDHVYMTGPATEVFEGDIDLSI